MKETDILITNGIVMTMNSNETVIPNGAVAISGDRIADIGPCDKFSNCRAGKVIDAKNGIIMPGLINTHTHASMSCFRGLADDLHLMTWLNDYIFPAESKLNYEKVKIGALLACAEMILSGTTCFADMYLFEDAVAEAAKAAGVRAVVGEVLYDFPSPSYGLIEEGFVYTENLIKKWKNDPLITVAVEPHSPYLCAPDLLIRAGDLSNEYEVPLIIHVAETQTEVSTIFERYGKTPIAHLAEIGVLSPFLLACHCVALTDKDIEQMAFYDVKVSHNPESNMKLASGIAPVPEMMDAGVCVGLGTDGCTSNNNIDMFLEMDTAAKIHKVNTLDPTVMDAKTVLKMATRDAAKALGLENLTGSLVPGKKADVIVIDTNKPHLTPMYNLHSHLVYAAGGNDVDTSIINGQVVMENRQLLTLDIAKVMADVNQVADEVKLSR
ncbi:MAG: amidohydrolase [Desulfobacteraceae bacterium]|nr:amidohydrolase [Desulfobacteraceae bacterium]MBC2754270.1 amidohydrolase [Desulfobacteraceae bacterium]